MFSTQQGPKAVQVRFFEVKVGDKIFWECHRRDKKTGVLTVWRFAGKYPPVSRHDLFKGVVDANISETSSNGKTVVYNFYPALDGLIFKGTRLIQFSWGKNPNTGEKQLQSVVTENTDDGVAKTIYVLDQWSKIKPSTNFSVVSEVYEVRANRVLFDRPGNDPHPRLRIVAVEIVSAFKPPKRMWKKELNTSVKKPQEQVQAVV